MVSIENIHALNNTTSPYYLFLVGELEFRYEVSILKVTRTCPSLLETLETVSVAEAALTAPRVSQTVFGDIAAQYDEEVREAATRIFRVPELELESFTYLNAFITTGGEDIELYKEEKLIFPEPAECGCGFFGPGKLFEKHTAQMACKVPHHDPTNLLKAIIFAQSKGLSSFVSAAAEVIFQAVTQDTSESATVEMSDTLRLERLPGFRGNAPNGVMLLRTDEDAGPSAGVASNKYQLIKVLHEERKGRRPDELDWRYASLLGPYLNVFL